MNITDIIMNFRSGLRGLIPFFEEMGIPWKRPDAYDEWDNTASAIYQALVIEPLRSRLAESGQNDFDLPEYDLLLPDYSGKSIIELLPKNSENLMRVFHSFGTDSAPLDIVEYRIIGGTGLPHVDTLESTPLSDVKFGLRLYGDGFSADVIEEVSFKQILSDPS